MIIQGTNVPIEIVFDRSVAEIAVLVASAWAADGTMLKKWEKGDMDVAEDGVTVQLPLAEEETAAWPKKTCGLEVKGLDEDGNTVFWDKVGLDVRSRHDRVILLTEV